MKRWLLLLALVWTLLRRAYVTPATRVTGDLIPATEWNQNVVSNIQYLKSLPLDVHEINEATDYSTSSTTFVNVDATDAKCTLVLDEVSDVLVLLNAMVTLSGSGTDDGLVCFDLDVDGVMASSNLGIQGVHIDASVNGGIAVPLALHWVLEDLSAGTHTIKLQWRVYNVSGTLTATMFAGAGTAGRDFHPMFSAFEI